MVNKVASYNIIRLSGLPFLSGNKTFVCGTQALLQIVRSFSLISSLQGAGTDDETLKRIVISRCEVDMENIKGEYQTAYKETLGKAISVSNNIFNSCDGGPIIKMYTIIDHRIISKIIFLFFIIYIYIFFFT